MKDSKASMTITKRIGLGVTLLAGSIVLLGIVGIALLNTDFAHRYLLRLVTERAQETVGGPVEIGGLAFHHWRFGADFYRISLHGSQPAAGVPFLTADRLSVDVTLHPFRQRKLDIDNVTLDHAVMHLLIGPKGDSNLPAPSTSGSSTSPFDLAIGHLELNQGELFYNDRRIPLTADLRDLNARALYNSFAKSYDTTLSYRDAQVRYAALRPFTHALQMSLAAGPSGLTVKSLNVQSGSSWVKGQGQIQNYNAPEIAGAYQASLSMTDLASLSSPEAGGSRQSLAGRIDTQGTMSYRNSDQGRAIDNLAVSGQIRGDSVTLETAQVRLATRSLAGEYILERGSLEVRKVNADLLGGHISGHLSISQISGAARARLEAAAKGISLSNMQNALRAEKLSGVQVRGLVDGNVTATWNGSMKDLRLASKASVSGAIAAPAGSAYDGSFPINGALQAAYDGDKQIVTLQDSHLSTPHSNLVLNGRLGNQEDLTIDARSDDLHELGLLILAFRPPSSPEGDSGPTSQLLRLAGQGSFNGSVRGTLANPEIAGSLDGTNIRVGDTNIAGVQAAIQASPNGFAAHRGELRIGPQGRAEFDVSIGLQDWGFAPDRPVAIRLSADRLSASDLQHVAGLQYPVTGNITANLNLSGTRENPNAQGNVRLTQAELWHQPVKDLSIGVNTTGAVLDANVHVQIPAGSVNGMVRYDPKNEAYDLQASSTPVQLNQVHYIQEHAQKVAGVVQVSVNGHGTTKSPQLDARIDSPQLQIGQQSLDGFTAHADLAQQKAAFEIGTSISGASLRAQGTVELTGNYEATASIDSQVIQLKSLLETFLPQAASDVHGSTQLHGTLKGPLKDPSRLEAHVDVPSFEVGYESLQFAMASPIHIDYQQGVLAVKRTEFKGTGTDVVFEASVPLRAAGNLTATANGTVDLQLLQLLNRQWQSSGRLDLRIGAQGSHTNPQISGTATVVNGSISMGTDVPTLEKINGELDITGQRVQVKSLAGQLGGGDFQVGGFATYEPNIQYDFVMKARRVRFLYPDGMRTLLTANINFTGQPSNSLVAGQVTVDRLSLTQSFDLGSFGSAFSAPSSPSVGMAENIKLNIAVSSSQELQLASSQLNVQGTADLRVQGTLADPVVIGRTNLTGGEVFFNGRRFQVQNATIQFANPVRTEPVINLTATTTVNQFNLNINLVGPLDRLRTTYTSDPPLPPVDVINLLITGHTTEAAQASSPSPMSVLAGQLGSQASSRLQKLTGISSLTIDPQIGGNQGNAASQLAIQERVTKNLFFTFATDVTTTQGEVVQVEYQVTRRYSVSAVRDQTGGYQVQIKAHKTF